MKVMWQSSVFRKTAVVLLLAVMLVGLMIGQTVLPAQAQSTNLAQGRPVTCSSTENASLSCPNAVDGNTSTRWASAFSDPQWIYVDLGASTSISRVVLNWEAAYGRSYQVQVSGDASTWSTIYSTTTGNGGIDDLAVAGSGRYVRIYGTVRATPYGYSLFELQVYGGTPPTTPPPTTPPATTPPPSGNLALNRPVTFSNQQAGNEAAKAVDGNTTTRWAGSPWPQWLQVDLGAAYSLNRTELMPYSNRAYQYRIEVSTNGTTYTTAADRTSNTTGGATLTDSFASVSARYVRLTVTGASGYTGGWASFYEFRVFGGGTPPPTTPPPTTPPPTTPPPTTPPPTTPPPGNVDFGPNVHIFNPSMSASSIQTVISSVYNAQQNNHFGDRRDALVFLPGTYNVDIGVGFYTEVLGLGATPDAVNITGNLHSDAYLGGNNATQNFWRGATNFSVTPNNGTVKWAVSQAIWFRQMHVRGNIALHQNYGWASGGWMANTRIDNNVDFGSQQQWISRNTQAGGWSAGSWNMVFVGVTNPPSGNWPSPPYTKIATTPVIREKPFLQIDGAGNYSVRVPALKANSSGYDWAGGSVPGTTIPIDQFYIAHAGDSAATINAQLAAGKHLILTPGIYALNDTIRVTRANTVVLGMGLATLRPTTGATTMTVADVDGVIIAGVLFDAGTTNSPVQLEVGTAGNTTSHAANPIVLHDVIFRVGGAAAGKTNVSMRVNANDTVVDHTWVWRADHGSGVGWTSNTAANGVVVNGNNITMYGLFVEHYQQYQTLWNGNGGRVYFYQSEDPYDPPNQASWTSGPGINGWASYKVSDNVTSHEAWGLGIYSVFSNAGVNQTRAIEVPVNQNVRFHSMVIKDLAQGHIQYVINNVVGPTVNNYP